jgi:catechol 2,3-dioxygenase-like lactoylglutathione lyase family enzyme
MADVFDHVTIRVSDVDASLPFYELAFARLGYGELYRGEGFGFYEWNDFSIWAAETAKPVTRGLHLLETVDGVAADPPDAQHGVAELVTRRHDPARP